MQFSHFLTSLRSRLFLFVYLISIGLTQAQTTTAAFFQGVSGSTTLTTNEANTRTKVLTDTKISSSWVVQVNPIENYLTGNHLSFTLPGNSRPIEFDADYVSSETDGSFYWLGYGSNGSIFDISKFANGSYHGGIYDASSGSRYQLISLSTSRSILVKYTTPTSISSDCVGSQEVQNMFLDDVEPREYHVGCEVNLIRILFVFTPGAAATGINPTNVAIACINELTAAANTSGVTPGTVGFLAAAVLPFSFTETGNITNDRISISANSTVQGLRDANYADYVVVLTAPSYGTLLGAAVSTITTNGSANPTTDDTKAFAMVVINGAVGPAAGAGFSAVHEIGHLTFARHQFCSIPLCSNLTDPTTDGCDNSDTDAHGFLLSANGTTFATVMVQNQCAAPRILRWSNRNRTFMGQATGKKKEAEDYKIFAGFAEYVSCIRSAPPAGDPLFGLTLDGDASICASSPFEIYTVAINSFNVVYPLSYSWEISATGTGGFTQVGTGSTFMLTSVTGLPNPFFLRVTVTDYGLKTATTQRTINIASCVDDGGSDDRTVNNSHSLEQKNIYPNPTTGIVNLLTTETLAILKLTDSNGRLIQVSPVSNEGTLFLDLSDLPSGIYYLHATENGSLKTFKVVKL